ncbi:MAG TPA: hypothetical protein VJQ25_14265, partial [Nitrospira sp.]|nr:hypothetical protein [Nitrospira sp.]
DAMVTVYMNPRPRATLQPDAYESWRFWRESRKEDTQGTMFPLRRMTYPSCAALIKEFANLLGFLDRHTGMRLAKVSVDDSGKETL